MQSCFRLLTNYEKAHHVAFGHVLFIRPDLLPVGDVPPLLGLGPPASVIPQGIVYQRFNDHLYLCPRSVCTHFFNLPDFVPAHDGTMLQ